MGNHVEFLKVIRLETCTPPPLTRANAHELSRLMGVSKKFMKQTSKINGPDDSSDGDRLANVRTSNSR